MELLLSHEARNCSTRLECRDARPRAALERSGELKALKSASGTRLVSGPRRFGGTRSAARELGAGR